MREIKKSSAFKKDLKREAKGANLAALNAELPMIISLLANDQVLPGKYKDHALSGNWVNHRECHIKDDLLPVYRKPGEGELYLYRIGSHAELFG
jgi:mRNA interferase YafQ